MRAVAFLQRRWLAVALAVGGLAIVLPLCQSRVLPFHDASGITGLGGALAHLDDPQARVRELYDLDVRLYPSVLYFGWAAAAGKLGVSTEVAFSVFTALFSLLGPPLAMLALLRAFRRPLWLALLVFPVSYHHQIWFGFLGSSAAITGLVLALACAKRALDEPRWTNHLGLAAAVLLVAMAHPFPLALTLAVIAPLVLWPPAGPDWRRRIGLVALRVACLVPTALFLRGWFASFFVGGAGGHESVFSRARRELRFKRPGLLEDAQIFLRWLGDGYQGGWDELVPGLALATLLVLLVVGVRGEAAAPAPREDRGWRFLAGRRWCSRSATCSADAADVAAGLVGRARPLRGAALPRAPRAAPPAVARPAALGARAGLRGGGHLRGLHHVRPARLLEARRARWLRGGDRRDPAGEVGGRVHAGPRRALRAAAPLHRPALRRPQGRPGRPVPARPPRLLLADDEGVRPFEGDARQFVWERHAEGYDYFLQELPMKSAAADPFKSAPPGAVGVVQAKGRWVVYKRLVP